MQMVYSEKQAQHATLSRISAISGTFYARRVGICWPFNCDSEEWSPIPLETIAPGVHGQYKGLSLQGTHPATRRSIIG